MVGFHTEFKRDAIMLGVWGMSCKNHDLEGYAIADKFRLNKCYLYFALIFILKNLGRGDLGFGRGYPSIPTHPV